ncbi:MAG: alanyl-tRNA editing protein [Bryobacteraceae bacterium]
MTERLYYTDSYLRDFSANVIESADDGRRIYLDRTAFYPTSGGQPHDTGEIAGVRVIKVEDEEDRVAHVTAAPVSGEVQCRLDWARRLDHMQQHSGQHLLSAVLERLGLSTISFHLGEDISTIDLEATKVQSAALQEGERLANAAVCENLPIEVSFEDAETVQALRKPSERSGTLRVVTIEGLDRSACGGTHVRRTGEIGPILLRRVEKVRNTTRVEFLCGARAIQRARADYDALARAAQLFSGALDDVPSLVASQLEAARTAEKGRQKLAAELAQYHARELYRTALPGDDGVRRLTRREAAGNLEDLRAMAQNFTAQPKAMFIAALDEPPAVLLATSADSGVDAGKVLKAALTAAGGRGGGNARLAQGSVPSRDRLESVLESIRNA